MKLLLFSILASACFAETIEFNSVGTIHDPGQYAVILGGNTVASQCSACHADKKAQAFVVPIKQHSAGSHYVEAQHPDPGPLVWFIHDFTIHKKPSHARLQVHGFDSVKVSIAKCLPSLGVLICKGGEVDILEPDVTAHFPEPGIYRLQFDAARLFSAEHPGLVPAVAWRLEVQTE